DVKVDGFSDLTVTAYFASGANSIKTTIGHGLPFAYVTKTGGDAQVVFNGTPTIWTGAGTNAVGVSIHGHNYAVFAPTGAAWTLSGTVLQSHLAGKDYYSVALLPDGTPTTFNDFKTYAFAFVTGSTVSWSYNQSASNVTTTFNITTTA